MICPHCGKTAREENIIPCYALHNAGQYHQTVSVAALCCGRPLKIYTRVILDVRAFTPHEGENVDDWGTEYK